MSKYIIKKIKFSDDQLDAIDKAIDNKQIVTLNIDYEQLTTTGRKHKVPFTARQYNNLKVNQSAKLTFHIRQVQELARSFDKEFEIDELAFRYLQ